MHDLGRNPNARGKIEEDGATRISGPKPRTVVQLDGTTASAHRRGHRGGGAAPPRERWGAARQGAADGVGGAGRRARARRGFEARLERNEPGRRDRGEAGGSAGSRSQEDSITGEEDAPEDRWMRARHRSTHGVGRGTGSGDAATEPGRNRRRRPKVRCDASPAQVLRAHAPGFTRASTPAEGAGTAAVDGRGGDEDGRRPQGGPERPRRGRAARRSGVY